MPSGLVDPDLIVVGRIATLASASGFGWVEALAISGGRVRAIGAAADVLGLAAAGTTVWRLAADKAVVPSITDAHLHLAAAAMSSDQPDLGGCDVDQVQAIMAAAHRDRSAAGDADGWLLGHGWSFDALGVQPRATLLDEAAPGRPMALWAHDHHSRWLSTEALRRAALADRADPTDGRIERDRHGKATGLLLEGAAGLVDAVIPEPAPERIEAVLHQYAGLLAGLGVTSVHDPGGLAPDPDLHAGPVLYRRLATEGTLPLRVTASVREEQLERTIQMGFRTGHGFPSSPADRYRDGWLKIFSDGALGSRTAAMLRPYEAADRVSGLRGAPTGMLLRDRRQLSELTRRAAAAGIASQIHAIGDLAVRTVLDALEGVPRVGRASHRVEHAQLVDAADVPRFGELGIAASVQPCQLISDAEAARLAWGDRSAATFPIGHLDKGGALLPFGTDAPVEPPDPWPGIAAAVTRRGIGWRAADAFHPEQAITLARALRAACLDGPRSLGVSDEGRLASGARADLLVIPIEALAESADPSLLASTRPLATMLDGELVYRDPSFDP